MTLVKLANAYFLCPTMMELKISPGIERMEFKSNKRYTFLDIERPGSILIPRSELP